MRARSSSPTDGPPGHPRLLSRRPFWVALRRVLTIGLLAFSLTLWTALFPLLTVLAVVVDLVRARRALPLLRTVTFFLVYLGTEAAGVAAAFLIWLFSGVWAGASSERYLAWNFRLQMLWVRALGGAGLGLFGVRARIVGAEQIGTGPILLLMRHVSVSDTVLAGLLVQAPRRLRLRYVLKRSLLLDPCLDIVGNRLPNRFTRRGSGAAGTEIAEVGRLAENLGPAEGVLIYPEGTRFTPRKREQVLRSLERRGRTEELDRARQLEHVLPPRPGGTLALLAVNARSAKPADVVFCAHAGLEGSASFAELANGALIGQTVRVRFWRIAASDVPGHEDDRLRWLHRQWRAVDEHVAGLPPAAGSRVADSFPALDK